MSDPSFRNLGGDVLNLADLGRPVGPYEEFTWPGYDPAAHGPVSGCEWLNPPPPDDPPDAGGTAEAKAAAAAKVTRSAARSGDEKTEASA